jgi:hypothetical protein
MKNTSRKLIYIGRNYAVKPEGFYFRNTNDDPFSEVPATNEQVWDEIKKLRHELFEAQCALRAIKTGVINIEPEKSYGDWSTKKIKTLDEAKKFATEFLNGRT